MTVLMALPVTNKITRSSGMQLEFRDMAMQFEEPYQQTAPKGLHPVIEIWDITWAPLTQVEYSSVRDAVMAVGTWGIFTWTPAYETVERKFKIKRGSVFQFTRIRAGAFQCSISLVETFGT